MKQSIIHISEEMKTSLTDWELLMSPGCEQVVTSVDNDELMFRHWCQAPLTRDRSWIHHQHYPGYQGDHQHHQCQHDCPWLTLSQWRMVCWSGYPSGMELPRRGGSPCSHLHIHTLSSLLLLPNSVWVMTLSTNYLILNSQHSSSSQIHIKIHLTSYKILFFNANSSWVFVKV